MLKCMTVRFLQCSVTTAPENQLWFPCSQALYLSLGVQLSATMSTFSNKWKRYVNLWVFALSMTSFSTYWLQESTLISSMTSKEAIQEKNSNKSKLWFKTVVSILIKESMLARSQEAISENFQYVSLCAVIQNWSYLMSQPQVWILVHDVIFGICSNFTKRAGSSSSRLITWTRLMSSVIVSE